MKKSSLKTCHICGAEFETTAKAAKYCSLACKYQALEERESREDFVAPSRACRSYRYNLICEICGAMFMATSHRPRTCSMACKRALLHKVRVGEAPVRSHFSKAYPVRKDDIKLIKRVMAKCPRCGVLHEYDFQFGFSGDARTLWKYCPQCTTAVESCSDIECLFDGGCPSSNLCVII